MSKEEIQNLYKKLGDFQYELSLRHCEYVTPELEKWDNDCCQDLSESIYNTLMNLKEYIEKYNLN